MASTEERPSFWNRVSTFFSHVTIEPVFFLNEIASSLEGHSYQLLSLYKICLITYNHPEDVCANMSAHAQVEKEVQAVETDYHMYRSLITHIPLIFVSLCMGAWSDRHNRKIPLIIAKMGVVLASVVLLLNSLFIRWPAEFLFIPPAILGFTGSRLVFYNLALSFVADRTKAQHRIWRFGLLEASTFMGYPIGTVSSGYIHKYWGFVPIFATSMALRVLCVLYLVVRLRNVMPNESNTRPLPGSQWRNLFNWKHFVDCMRTCTKNRDGHGRAWILLILLANWTMTIPGSGEGAVSQLYFFMHRHWSFVYYNNYSSLGTGLVTVSLLTLMPLLTYVLKLSNPVMELIGNTARIANPVIVALSPKDWMVWSASALTLFYPFCYPAMSSMLTQLVEPNEIGKVLSVKCSSEVVIPLFSSVIYTQLYQNTKTTFGGAFLLLSASFCAVSAIAFIFILIDSLRFSRQEYNVIQPTSSQESINNAIT